MSLSHPRPIGSVGSSASASASASRSLLSRQMSAPQSQQQSNRTIGGSGSGSGGGGGGGGGGGVIGGAPILQQKSSMGSVPALSSTPSSSKVLMHSARSPTAAQPPESDRPLFHFTLRLVTHPKSFSSEDMIVNPKAVPGLRVGDLVEIFQPEVAAGVTATAAHATGTQGKSATGVIQRNTATSLAAASVPASQSAPYTLDPHNALFLKIQVLEPVKANFDISLSTALADLFSLQARREIVMRTLSPESINSCALDFVEISFKNQYIGRSDNWRIKHQLQGRSVFSAQTLQVEGMKMRVDEILLNGRSAKSGIITTSTRFTFRSRSARLFFLIQLSEEMWEFADDGELYFEKVLGFLKILFAEWHKLKVTHALSIIFFSRTFLDIDEEWLERKRKREMSSSDDDDRDDRHGEEEHGREDDEADASSFHAAPASPPVQTDANSGRQFQDHYMVVVDCEVHDFRQWDDLIKLLKKKFNKYHTLLKWGATDPISGLRGFPSSAAEGNFLESINMAVSVYDKHYLDRDLYKTGQNMVLFSAGIGMFVVDSKLARLTKQRMVDGGIGCDLICMTRPPLHSVPLFNFKGVAATAGANSAVGLMHASTGGGGLQKEQSKLFRSQTGPAALSSSNPIRRGSSHHNSSFNTIQAAIQEGSEEGDMDAEKEKHRSASPVPSTALLTPSPPTSQAAPFSSLAHTDPSTAPVASSDNPTSLSFLLPPSSDLSAQRIERSPSPSTPAPHSSNSSSSSASPPATSTITAGGFSPSPEAPIVVRIHSMGSDHKDLSRPSTADSLATSAPQQPQYYVPHWLSIYFYDYQDLYDTPFGSLKTSHRDDTSRNRNEEFVSLSSCKLFDFFDLSFFNTGQHSKPSLVPYYPAKEIAPPIKPSLFDAYDASLFNNAPLQIGVTSSVESPPAPFTPITPSIAARSPDSAVRRSPQPSMPQLLHSPGPLQLPSTLATLDPLRSDRKSLKKKPNNSMDSNASDTKMNLLSLPHSSTSGPNVALQQHVLNQGQKTSTTAFQTRWGHLFGHLYATLDHLHNPLRPNWKSLCQPAILPLTTEYWPALAELRLNYFEYNHTLVLVQNQNDYNNNTAALLEEVICQRQAQDYQHIVSDEIPLPKNGSGLTVQYFSLRNQVHQITMDRRTNTIDVRRHVHKRVIQDMKLVKFPYSYFLWSQHTNSFLAMQRDIEPNRDELKWSDADNLLCDRYSAELTEEMKYRRNHYAIIPAGIPAGKFASEYALTSTSKRFAPQAEALRKRYEEEWSKESEKRIAAMKQFFTFMFADKGDKIVAAAAAAAAVLPSSNSTTSKDKSTPALTPESVKEKAEKYAAAEKSLDQAFASFGIKIDMNDHLPLPLPPVKSEEQRREQQKEVEEHLDTYENALGFAIANIRTSEIKIPLTSVRIKSSGVGEEQKRYEWIQLEYDALFNPHAVFHMEIKWLVATGMHLENWIKNFIKKAETRFGLQIVKIPTNQPLRSADSFHVPVPLPVPNPHVLRLLEEFLIVECGFVMDSELQGGCRQYVHESGMCAVRRLPSGLIWVNNHLPSASQHRRASVHLFNRIKTHAQRIAQMRSFVKNLVSDVTALQDMKSIMMGKR